MENQWPGATQYQSGSSGMHCQEPISAGLLAMPFTKKLALTTAIEHHQ